jgi:CPA2 family monovalent cation:H+ antiporter-2
MGILMWAGASLGLALGWNTVEALFLGASIAISSTMVVSSVFAQRPVTAPVRQHVLGVLVLQDVVAIALIAAMTAVAAGGGLQPRELATTLAELAATLAGMLVIGMLVVPPMVRAVARLDSPETMTVAATGLCFAMALLAERLGYSVALGAFIAGILVAESGQGHKTEHVIGPVRDMFAAIFFVSIGMTVDPMEAWRHLSLSLMVFGLVVAAQLTSVTLAGVMSGMGLRRSLIAGCALGQIGEFAFIIGGIGIAAGAARPELQPILVTVAVLTAFTTPQMLRVAEPMVAAIDRRMPHAVQHFLGMYEEWFERLRAEKATERPPLRRAVKAFAFDGGALIALAAITALSIGSATRWLAARFALSEDDARWIGHAAVLLLAAPLAFGLVRNTVAFVRLAVAIVGPKKSDPAACWHATPTTMARPISSRWRSTQRTSATRRVRYGRARARARRGSRRSAHRRRSPRAPPQARTVSVGPHHIATSVRAFASNQRSARFTRAQS